MGMPPTILALLCPMCGFVLIYMCVFGYLVAHVPVCMCMCVGLCCSVCMFACVCMHVSVSAVWSALVPAPVLRQGQRCETQERRACASVRARRMRADMGWGRAWQEGWTPLHMASKSGWEATAQLLIDKGADVNARSKVRTSGPARCERRLGLAGH